MPEPDHDDMLWLLRLADGCYSPPGEERLQRLVGEGLVRAIEPDGVEALRRRQEALDEIDRLDEAARLTRRPGGFRSFLLWLSPGRRQKAREAARELRNRAQEIERGARQHWLGLSQRDLLHVHLPAFISDPEGGLIGTTDRGRGAVREYLHSAVFENTVADADSLMQRAERCLELRARMIGAGFKADPRVNLAAAVLSRRYADIELFSEINRLAAGARWGTYDRLPVIARMCGVYAALDAGGEGCPPASAGAARADSIPPPSAGAADDVWEWFRAGYAKAMEHDLPAGFELRLATLSMLSRGPVDDAACRRLRDISAKLRLAGWTMDADTYVVAARLGRLLLSETEAAARARRMHDELSWGGNAMRPMLTQAAGIAGDSNLFPLSAMASGAQVMEQQPLWDGLAQRYDDLVRMMDDDDRAAPVAALLAIMPGTASGNRERLQTTRGAISEDIAPPNDLPCALMLLDSAYPHWADATRFVWEAGSLLQGLDITSVFGMNKGRPL